MTTPAVQQHTDRPRRGKLRRLGRLALLTLMTLVIIGGCGLWISTRSWFLIGRITPVLSRRMGGQVLIDQAAYTGGGRIELNGFRLLAPGLSGPAAEVASIRRAVVKIDLGALLLGRIRPLTVELDDPVIRMSEDAHRSGRMNLLALDPKWTSDDKSADPPPRVRISNAALEYGSHDGPRFELMGRRVVSGEMHSTAGATGWYNFELGEVDDRGASLATNGIFIKGQWNFATNEHHSRIDGLELDDRIYRMCPVQVRLWWDRMQLQGKVDGITINWRKDKPLSIEFGVENIAMTSPIDTGDLWWRYREGQMEPTASQPRLQVNSGTIRLGADSFTLADLKGVIGSSDTDTSVAKVPYSLNLTIFQLPPLEWSGREAWMERVLTTCPFEMKVRMDDFSLQRDDAGNVPAVELPKVVARVLSKFQMINWVLSTSVEVSRGTPVEGADGTRIAAKPVTNGQAYIHKASGRYAKFPYRVDDIDAYLQFDNDKLTLHYLTGHGAGGSQVRITGEVSPPDNDARIALQIIGKDLPIDDRLREAMKGSERAIVDSLLHRPSSESLAAAGLLPDQAAIDRITAELSAATKRMVELRDAKDAAAANAAEIASLQSSIDSMQRSIDAGPFQLGGMVNLDLRIDRDYGVQKPTTTTGTISLQHVGMLYEKFPYPLWLTGGAINWDTDRVEIVPGPDGTGIPFVTAGGAQGFISGQIGLVTQDGNRSMRPNLTVTVRHDRLTPSLAAAIPAAAAELAGLPDQHWLPGRDRSRAAAIFEGLGLSGSVDFLGTIHSDPAGVIGYDFDVQLPGGEARPNRLLSAAINATGELWPPGLTLTGVHGDLHISRDSVDLRQLAGAQGSLTVDAAGTIKIGSEHWDSDLAINFHNLPLDSYVVNLAPPTDAAAIGDLWKQFQPRGTFDATYTQHPDDAGARSDSLTVTPHELSLLIDGRRTSLKRQAGDMIVSNDGVGFRTLALSAVDDKGASDGDFRLDGMLGIGDASATQLDGDWVGGRFESPWVMQALTVFNASDLAKPYLQLQPAGRFAARFALRRSPNASLDYTIQMRPQTLAVKLAETLILTDFSQGEIAIRHDGISLSALHGTIASGAFDLSGDIRLGDSPRCDLQLAFDGRMAGADFQALLPAEVRSGFQAIGFDDGGQSTLSNGRLTLSRLGDDPPSSIWNTHFSGDVRTRGASLQAGVPIKGMDGTFALDVLHSPGSDVRLDIHAAVDRVNVMGLDLTNLTAPIRLDHGGDLIRITGLRASAAAGVVTLNAAVGLGERRDYTFDVNLVGVPLRGFLSHAGTADAIATTAPAGPTPTAPKHDEASGDMFASFAMSGLRDDIPSRRGRGVVRILHGNMAGIPLALQVVQLVQFTLPFSGNLDYADTDMYIAGDQIAFERILLESTVGSNAALQLFGEGTLNFETLELNTRFRSRSGVAIIRDIVGGISDQLYAIEVTGPLSNPKSRIIPLPAKTGP